MNRWTIAFATLLIAATTLPYAASQDAFDGALNSTQDQVPISTNIPHAPVAP